MNVDEQYLKLLSDILENGSYKLTRSGAVLSLFDRNLSFNMSESFPLLTTKKVYTRAVIHELLWFLKGETNIKYLLENNVHIWDGDAYRFYKQLVNESNEAKLVKGIKYSDEIYSEDRFKELVLKESVIYLYKLTKGNNIEIFPYKFGDLGDIYGKQWRKYGISGKDQIKEIIETLKKNPNDRRLLCVAYNPDVLDKVALPPCYILFQFYARPLSNNERLYWLQNNSNNKYDEYKTISDDKLNELNVPKYELSLKWIQRSVDTFLGLPFNITSYSLLLAMIAQCVNMTIGTVSCSLGDCHIYEAHIEAVKEQLTRDPLKFSSPKLKINPNVKDIDSFTIDDFEIKDYQSYPAIKAPLCVG